MTCKNCGHEMKDDEVFCEKCGFNANENKKICKNCGHEMKDDEVFCEKCGFNANENKKICKNCGHEMKDNEVFCEKCGFNANEDKKNRQNYDHSSNTTKPKPKKNINLKILIPIIAATLAVVVGLSVLFIQLGRISFKNYINDEIVLSGYDGYATASADSVVDYNSLINHMGAPKNLSWDDESYEEPFYEYIRINLDKYENISNGDVITATITVNYVAINRYKYDKKLVGKDTYTKEYTVSGLEESSVINPFEIVKDVVYDKTSDSCIINLNTSYNKKIDNFTVRYYADGYEGIQVLDPNGEEVGYLFFDYDIGAYASTKKVSLSINYDETDFSSRGLIISPVNQEIAPITCNYLTNFDNISKKDFDTLKARAIKEFNEEYPNAKYIKAYFGYDKNGEGNASLWNSGYYNQIKFVFSYEDGEDTLYRCLSFSDIKLLSTGSIVDPDSIESYIGSYSETIDELETDLNDTWTSISTVSK